LELVKKARPDLIISDIVMPEMDGFDFYNAIRAQADLVSVPFIFLTAKTDKKDIIKGKSLGAEDYLTKPFDRQELIAAVSSRLKRVHDIHEASEAKFEKLKGQITGILSHELRTPLTYVQGYTTLALDEISPSAEGIQDFLVGIKRGTDRLNKLVEDLMLMVQIDAGQAAAEFKELAVVFKDIKPVLLAVLQSFKNRALEKKVILKNEIPPNLPPVRICEHFFRNALSRLVDNAIKFSTGEGNQVTLKAQAEDQWLEVSLSDQGVGIAPKDLPFLFERFRQIDRDTMEQQGVGLGLALAQELIKLHGGEITVNSMPKLGSVFSIRLPVVKE
jgi:signal transduction histidine kinase